MSNSYNSVAPFKLGSARSRKKDDSSNNNKTATANNLDDSEDGYNVIDILPLSNSSKSATNEINMKNKINSDNLNNNTAPNQNNFPFAFQPQNMGQVPFNPYLLPNISNNIPANPQLPFITPNFISNLVPTSSGTMNDIGLNQKRPKRTNHNMNSNIKNRNSIESNKNNGSSIKGSMDLFMNDTERRRKRAEKFNTPTKTVNKKIDIVDNFNDLNAISSKSEMYDKNKKIVGCCQTLEKSYLRLTSEPDPNLVRPLTILKKHFANLEKLNKKGTTTYKYLCDQLKAIRQDLRVQMIENQFTVKIYQEHARIALENGDIGEFNQCLSRLYTLFEKPNIKTSCIEEFTTYRILYYILTENYAQITALKLDLLKNKLAVHNNFVVQIAFLMAEAHIVNNYNEFMELAALLDGRAQSLINIFIDKTRMKALLSICKAYNQISIDFLIKELRFSNYEDIERFFTKNKLSQHIVVRNEGQENEFRYLESKNCRAYLAQFYSSFRKIEIKGQK
ncbi:hypothetical protein TPHA_0B01330 [Tetrapisispora phaffii CBS 4417]|uniref:PCI domain-containing protein n=1 Tax=Tetrapisispora phaffii (strain ATCC 24235 / CBS 4417 / NBRC 1672 / NRRL Y-8282 / UCD 70-5) TaxID=1071381 RepID=G8BP75_TETPH|nr:hypothetical protein TPHA_0B01330 [Tetrapisispora phaffii CBS 4417]CCE61806.1 hypothetical protein TPHA_0B01330 [Tetrapisispora phaffii CBS 4417]